MDLKILALVFATGAATGAGTVKLISDSKPVELEVRWQNDHAWATGRMTDAGAEVSVRRCSNIAEPLKDGGVRLSDGPCTEHVLGANETSCWQSWLKCSGQ